MREPIAEGRHRATAVPLAAALLVSIAVRGTSVLVLRPDVAVVE